MIFAGAVGNQIDRFRYGYVTDFIYVRIWDNLFWPAFNVADSAITIGSISLAIIILIGLRKKRGTAGNTGEREGGESGSQNISS
jgi:signal peptidase II